MEALKDCYQKHSESFLKDISIFWKDELEPIFFDRIVRIKYQTRNNSNVICVLTNTGHIELYLKHEKTSPCFQKSSSIAWGSLGLGWTILELQRFGFLPETSLKEVVWPYYSPVKSEIWHPPVLMMNPSD